MLTSFYPTNCRRTSYVPYMSDAIAEVQDAKFGTLGVGITNGTFESVSIRKCIRGHALGGDDEEDEEKETYPLLLFSPGLGGTRILYSNLLSSIASQGFVVVSVDHPYDASAVEFSDGEVIQGINMKKDTSTTVLDLKTRVEDMRFVLDNVSPSAQEKRNKPNAVIPPSLLHKTKISDPVIFGHSFGGATAAQTLAMDTRFVGGVNLDGILFGSVVGSGFGKPFVEIKSQTPSSQRDSTWEKFFGNLSGWKLEVLVQGAKHESFSDLGEVVDGLSKQGPKVEEVVGTIDGERMSEIMTAYVSAAARKFVLGTDEELLDGASDKFPEVKF